MSDVPRNLPGRPLASGQALPLGAHIVTPRRGYTHHGIYVGQGRVVQYRGLVRGLRAGPVEEVPLAQFADGYALWVRAEASPCFDGAEVVRRARSRIGENCYHLLTNNCEHFCEWCLRAEPRSYQVDEWFSRPRRALRTMISSVSMSWSSQDPPQTHWHRSREVPGGDNIGWKTQRVTESCNGQRRTLDLSCRT